MAEMTTGAKLAIHIAEKTFPADLIRQRDLARDIIDAINLSEAEFAREIIQKIKSGAAVSAPSTGESNG